MVEQGNYVGNKLFTSLKRREKETVEKRKTHSGELPSIVAHSLVPSHERVSVSVSPSLTVG